MNSAFVCLMGMGTVFIGLICIIAICLIMGLFFRNSSKKQEAPAPVAAAPVKAAEPGLSAQEKQKIIAGTCAVIAEELGTDVSNIRVLSFKRV